MSVARSLVSALARRDPLVAGLARRAALAVRVEPGLLRRIRLKLLPGADASAEADLWMSGLVQSRSTREMAFSPSVARELRSQLAEDDAELARTYELIATAHAAAPPLVRLEEELVFAGLSTPPDQQRISELLRTIVASMRQGPQRTVGLSSWFMTNFGAWPLAVCESDEARALALVAGTRVPRPAAVAPGLPSQRGWRLVEALLPSRERKSVVLRRTQRHLEFGFGTALPGSHRVPVPESAPRLEIVGWGCVTVTPETQRLYVGDEHELRIRTPDGATFALRPQLDDREVMMRATVIIERRGRERQSEAVANGFLCRADQVITTRRAVGEHAPHELSVRFYAPFEQRTVEAIAHGTADLVVLRLSSAVSGRAPLDKLGEASAGSRWASLISRHGEFARLAGTVESTPPTERRGNQVLLAVEAEQTLLEMQGAGSPVVANHEVIGLLAGDELVAGLLVAIPASAIAQALDFGDHQSDQLLRSVIEDAQRSLPAISALREKYGPSLTPEITLLAADRLIASGAFGVGLSLLEGAPDSVRRDQLRALALSKLKRHDEALPLLDRLIDIGYADAETLSLRAASHKRLWLEHDERSMLDQAFEGYHQAYLLTADPYPGINAAALALYKGDKDRSSAIAKQLVAILSNRADTATDAWRAASLGEAFLLTRNINGARREYGIAARLAGDAYQNVAVMRRQARKNLEYLQLDRALLDDCFVLPNALVFAGHPPLSGRHTSPTPGPSLDALRHEVRVFLAERDIRFGYAAPGRGPDLIFIDEMRRRGGRTTVFVPVDRQAFRREWVGFGWEGMFEQLITDPSISVKTVSETATDPYVACQRAALRACNAMANDLDQETLLLWVGPTTKNPVSDMVEALPNIRALHLAIGGRDFA